MKLMTIGEDMYHDYRLDVIFKGYKWDPQFLDNNTVSRHVLVITEEEHAELESFTKELYKETVEAEQILWKNKKLAKPLRLPRQIRKWLVDMENYRAENHIRLMRFDFHPVAGGGWAVSEVNSDVPGGFAEASLMPEIAGDVLGIRLREVHGNENFRFVSFGDILANAIAEKVKAGRCDAGNRHSKGNRSEAFDGCNGRIILIHCTSYSDDRQVMQYLGDKLRGMGFSVIYAAADHLRFIDNKAICTLNGNEGAVDAIVRFTPLEWLDFMKPKRRKGYYDTVTLSCNHPISLFAQTKRFPFIWDTLEKLGLPLTMWRRLLPETLNVKDVRNKSGYIFKPVYGRVGEKITIEEACREDEYEKTMKDVKGHPKKYVAQMKFTSEPLSTDEGDVFHVCLGAFCVEGKPAGYYARISEFPRIDSRAADIPVLIEKCVKPALAERGSPRQACSGFFGHYGRRDITAVNTFKAWAPTGAMWTDWVRPVLFAAYDFSRSANAVVNLAIPDIPYMSRLNTDTAIILDLPGYDSIKEALGLAQFGWRPIPLYNGTIEQSGAMALVDNHAIEKALVLGAEKLRKIEISPDAPPTFLLDSNRMNRHKLNESVFDNSWDLYEQDMPSAEYFLSNGITKIIVRGQAVLKDLHIILYKLQKKGIKILFTSGDEPAKELKLKTPPKKYI